MSSSVSPTRISRPLLLFLLAAPLALAAFGAGGNRAATAAVGDCSPAATWGTVRNDLAAQVVGMVNQHRAGIGLGGLSQSGALTAAATWKARHMAAYGYFSHDDPAPPVARTTRDRIAACGYSAGWGENIAYGHQSPASVMQGWLNSPGHRANIERSTFRAIGVGVAVAANGTPYWVQVFGSVADGGGAPPPPPPTPPTPPPSPPPAQPTSPPPPPTASAPRATPAPRRSTATPKPAAAPKPATAPKAATPPPAAPRPASAPSPSTSLAAAAKVPAVAKVRRRPQPEASAKVRRRPQLEASTLIQWGQEPRAGRRFTARLMITSTSTNQRVEQGHATCKARARGRLMWVGIHRFENGFVVCRWHLPKGVKDHRLLGTIRVHAGGKKTARWFSRVVR